jgi:hypothetical protein
MTEPSSGKGDTLPIRTAVQCIREHPVVFGVTVLTALAVGALIAWLVLAASGDEPPIRVKKGSIYFDIVNSPHKWKENPDKMNWRFTSGTRGNPYTVLITPKNPASCNGPLKATGNKITVIYREGEDATSDSTVTLEIVNNKTKLTSTVELEPENNHRRLRYDIDDKGFIAHLSVGATACNFTPVDGLEEAFVLDVDANP